jgi:cyclopropane fatty-acyl-phospholipid synthase-like methyltransferase
VVVLILALLTVAQRPATEERVAMEMLQFARVGAGDVVYDLGSAGAVPIAAAERFGARGIGIGLEPAEAERARDAARRRGVADRVSFVEGHLATAPYAEATVVILDLTPALNLRLEPVLRRELRPGARIVSHRYGIGAWRADDSVKASDGTMLFLWTVPRPPARTPDIFFVPTEHQVVEQMLELAGVTSQDVVHDLGSGDGRMVVIAAQKYGARGVGVEIDPSLVARARQVAREAQLGDRVTFVEGDLFDADLSGATVVTLFLSDRVNERLEAKLKRELKPGARIVSHQFRIGDWVPDRTVPAADGTSLFLWTIPPR